MPHTHTPHTGQLDFGHMIIPSHLVRDAPSLTANLAAPGAMPGLRARWQGAGGRASRMTLIPSCLYVRLVVTFKASLLAWPL